MDLEGWYEDLSGRWEARWYSAGAPTDLVRTGTDTGREPMPPELCDVVPRDLAEINDGADLRRAGTGQEGRPFRRWADELGAIRDDPWPWAAL